MPRYSDFNEEHEEIALRGRNDDLERLVSELKKQNYALTNPPKPPRPERTTIGHLGQIASRTGTAFLLLGTPAGAVIGDCETWTHFTWIPATFITIAIASVGIGVAAHVFGEG